MALITPGRTLHEQPIVVRLRRHRRQQPPILAITFGVNPHVRARCRYAHVVASGNAAEETIRLANEAHADLIVLGSQHKRFADASVIGATTERVVRFAKRGVWVVVARA